MAFILDAVAGADLEYHRQRFAEYAQYLDSIKERLPASARAFALADWHYDSSDPRCPHDAWVEALTISEPATGDRSQHRRVAIEIRLLGAYHDGHIRLSYHDVRSYTLDKPARSVPNEGHGDWIVDEVRLSDSGLVLHEIVFIPRCRWLIECRDIEYRWQLLAKEER